MISNADTAKRVGELLLEVSGILNESVGVVAGSDSPEDEKIAYMGAVGQVMGTIGLDILNKLYTAHPELLPEDYYLPGVSKSYPRQDGVD